MPDSYVLQPWRRHVRRRPCRCVRACTGADAADRATTTGRRANATGNPSAHATRREPRRTMCARCPRPHAPSSPRSPCAAAWPRRSTQPPACLKPPAPRAAATHPLPFRKPHLTHACPCALRARRGLGPSLLPPRFRVWTLFTAGVTEPALLLVRPRTRTHARPRCRYAGLQLAHEPNIVRPDPTARRAPWRKR